MIRRVCWLVGALVLSLVRAFVRSFNIFGVEYLECGRRMVGDRNSVPLEHL